MQRPHPRRRGFTLIELMIVVAIISILAAIAIPQFEQLQLRSRRSEAFANIKGIATAELAHYQLYNALVATSPSPPHFPDRSDHAFDPSQHGWADLEWEPDGRVRCQYWVQMYELGHEQVWVRPHAQCDLDGDQLSAIYFMDVDPGRFDSTAQHMVLQASNATAQQNRY